MDVGDHVKRIFAIQEERQAQYAKLRKAHERYISQQGGVEWYRGEMTGVTGHFQSLSQEVMACIGELRRRGMGCVATILENIQEKEKEKLQLTARWQENSCKYRQKREEEEEEEEEDFGASEHQKRELRKQLAMVEGDIAELLQELRYESEPYLLEQETADTKH